MTTPLVKYQAYELVQMQERSILHIPAPGTAVYLATDIDPLIERLAELEVALEALAPNHPLLEEAP